ncbi:dihydrolipoyl dehydrogenase [Thermosediminibacter litoriperuensis]|uniref:Dihydrolipoyl dehydrogenase n=1 Tax=Thermosediminibacter litoriperuensis TaxID=291989 RepID=A0A5S5AX45_9FIRM|nr:dihydrolipoyl dehydrogenase [Thermosediminibacter litoriperuensis]TYP56652.1 dihydrolipoamide dehydrogenase [Thermosediminibacter litoriperuensis]
MSKRIVVIGAGPGGYVAALTAAKLGAQVTVIEKDRVGGTCLNRGCIPTKALLASAEVLTAVREAEEYGIKIEGEIIPDMGLIIARKNKVVERLNKGIEFLFETNNVRLVKGKGTLVDNKAVKVDLEEGGCETLEVDNIIIATGSSPAKIPVFPFDGKKVLTSDEILNLGYVPSSIIIVGAGVIGCEFGTFFSTMGSAVTMVEMMERVLPTEDPDVGKEMEKVLKRKKIKLHLKSRIEKVEIQENGVKAVLDSGKELEAEIMLVATGRKAEINGIGLETVGVKMDKGRIIVDDRMETSVKGIYAIGDIVPGLQLAHVASFEGICAAENIMGIESRMDYSAVPRGIFTDPEVGAVGMTEEEALNAGFRIRTGRFYFRGLGRAQAAGKIIGFAKIIAEEDTDQILGASIMGPNATDLVHEIVPAIKYGITVKDLSKLIHSHPTFSEAVMEALHDVHGQSIHNA